MSMALWHLGLVERAYSLNGRESYGKLVGGEMTSVYEEWLFFKAVVIK